MRKTKCHTFTKGHQWLGKVLSTLSLSLVVCASVTGQEKDPATKDPASNVVQEPEPSDEPGKEPGDASADASADAPTTRETDAKPAIDENGNIEPNAIYLLDEYGQPIFIPKNTYSEFEQYLAQKNQANANKRPDGIIQSLTCDVQVGDTTADVSVLLEGQLFSSEADVIRIPIRLSHVSLTSDPAVAGSSNSFLRLNTSNSDGTKTGYEWWIGDASELNPKIQFSGKARVNQSSNRKLIEFDLPAAQSKLTFVIPGEEQQVQVVGPGIVDEVVEQVSRDGFTHATVYCTGGLLTVSWQQEAIADEMSSVDVTSRTSYRLVSEKSEWEVTSRLTFQSRKNLNKQVFDLRLPPNATWNEIRDRTSMPVYSVSIVNPPAAGSESPETEPPLDDRIRLQLAFGNQVETDSQEVEIAFQIPVTLESSSSFQLGSLSVENVLSHAGTVTFSVPAEFRFGWSSTRGIQLESQSRRPENVNEIDYKFQFDSQPYSLDTVLFRNQQRKETRSVYVVSVDDTDKFEMTGIIEFSKEFKALPNLAIDMKNWRLEEIQIYPSPASPVLYELKEGGLVVPSVASLLPQDGLDTARAFKIRATMDVSQSQNGIQFALPEFIFDGENETRIQEHGAGTLILSPKENLQLTPNEPSLTGLASESQTPALADAILQDRDTRYLLQYRFQSGSDVPMWSGALSVLPRQVSSESKITIRLSDGGYQMGSQWTVTSRNELLDRLYLLVPREIADQNNKQLTSFSIEFNDEPVTWSVVEDAKLAKILADESNLGEVDWAHWSLVELYVREFSSTFGLSVNLTTTSEGVDDTDWNDRSIKLITPLFGSTATTTATQASVIQPANIDLEFGKEQVFDSAPESSESIHQLLLSPTQRELKFRMRSNSTGLQQAIQVKRVWLQTSLNRSIQRDRFVVRITTEADFVRLLVEQAELVNPPQVLVNGNEVEAFRGKTASELRVPLPQQADKKHTIEVWTWRKCPDGIAKTIPCKIPNIFGAVPQATFVWEVETPASLLLLSSDWRLIPEYQWQFDWAGARRVSMLSRSQLEEWTMATRQIRHSENARRYVLSTPALIDELSVVVAPAYAIWLPIALLVIGIAGALSMFKLLRHPFTFLLIAVCIAASALLSKDFAVLAAQAAIGGLVILALWALTNAFVSRRVNRRSVFSSPSRFPGSRPVFRPVQGSSDSAERLSDAAKSVTASSTAER